MLTIKKAKLTAKEFEYHYSKEDEHGDLFTGSAKTKAIPHKDLYSSLNALSPHLAILCGYKSVKKIDANHGDLFDDFQVNGVSIGGDDSDPGVVISGSMRTSSGQRVILNTPFRRYYEEDVTRYVHMDDLIEKVNSYIGEVKSFINGNKRGDDAQLSLFEEDEKVTKAKILPEEKPLFKSEIQDVEFEEVKSKRRKKVPQNPNAPNGEIEE